jgi:glycosyltransferase involved in cell wall biosynthesis
VSGGGVVRDALGGLPPVLLVHSRYREPGGEDAVFEAESALLREHGVVVHRYEAHNDEFVQLGTLGRTAATVWNRTRARELAALVRGGRIGLVHFHNTFPLISPAAHRAVRAAGAAVVQTLHNYRLVCPGALLLRAGAPCEACVGAPLAWRGVAHACYRGSRAASAGAALMAAVHRLAGTWRDSVDAYIALSHFARSRFVAGGLPADRIAVKPNFVSDPGTGGQRGSHVLFVGRLSPEKGVAVLLEAWRELAGVPLRIVGAGPLEAEVRQAAARLPAVELLGQRTGAEVTRLMQEARLVVVPSLVYENFPLVIAEAYAAGTPVVASATGSLAELVRQEETGRTFPAGDARALAAVVRTLLADGERLGRLGAGARREYEARCSPAAAARELGRIYGAALARRGAATGPAGAQPEAQHVAEVAP